MPGPLLPIAIGIGALAAWLLSGGRKKRSVLFGRKTIGLPLAYHWALKVGDTWYEIPGTSFSEKGKENKVQAWPGKTSKSGAECCRKSGSTRKTDSEIAEFNKKYEKDHPTYNLVTDNCQTYVTELFAFLMTDGEKEEGIPSKQSPIS